MNQPHLAYIGNIPEVIDLPEADHEIIAREEALQQEQERYKKNPSTCPKCGGTNIHLGHCICGWLFYQAPVADPRREAYESLVDELRAEHEKKVLGRTYGEFICDRCGKPGIRKSSTQMRHKECQRSYGPHRNGPRRGA